MVIGLLRFPYLSAECHFRVQESEYVHGGISLQEVVVPVVKIHKARSQRQVEG